MKHDFEKVQVKVNDFKKSNPLEAKVLENIAIVNGVEDADVRHIVLETSGYDYREGQSAGVLAPGINEKGNPHAVRLYSISSMGSDQPNAEKLTLTVKRLIYEDSETKEIKKGVCSNYLRDVKVGETVKLTGPTGRYFLMPNDYDFDRPFVFIATGTGIAPFRGMIKRIYELYPDFKHPVYLLFGVRRQAECLYDNEFKAISAPSFHYHTAFSREQTNSDGSRKYVGNLMTDIADELKPVLENNKTLIYICGIKGMEDVVKEAIVKMKGEDFYQGLASRTLTEVY